jgi:alpha-mannosidase
LYDKKLNKEFVKDGGQLNRLRIYLEDKKGGMKSWTLNRIVKEEDVSDVESVKVTENGPVRACVETVSRWGKSKFIERTYIYRSYPRIVYDMEVHWLETGSSTEDSPMLRALFPVALENPAFNCQVPFDVVERPTDWRKKQSLNNYLSTWKVYESEDGQEVPAQKWVDISDGTTGVTLMNSTKYGHSYHNGDLRLTLMRSAGEPDIYPNLGKFNISYALYPHSDDWKNGALEEGEDFNVPVYASEPPSLAMTRSHSTRPEEASLISIDKGGIILSGIKKSEEGDLLVIRLAEFNGKESEVNLSLPVKVKEAVRLNIIELPLQGVSRPEISGNRLKFTIKPHEIVTLGIKTMK